ncbi:MAG TPA: sensor histidine kinase [Candidatus Dormibacteraeota bacterium]|jgi:signal transduction histidine kinase|nr:sensor histidine kinase [Candidatus Dormibacteraeota bacterium]
MTMRSARARPGHARRIPLSDLVLGAVITLISVGAAIPAGGVDERHPRLPGTITATYVLGVVLALMGSLPIVARRRWPLAVLGAVELAVALHLVAVDTNLRAGVLGLAIAVYTVAAHLPREVSLKAAVTVAGINTVIFIVLFAVGRSGAMPNLFMLTVLVAGSWALGDNIGTRRAYLATLEERAARLEREQQESSERAVLDERSRIARELHDVVAHHVSAIAVQAGAAEEIAEQDPRRAREVLGTIQSTSRQALAEMRALVGVLRDEPGEQSLAPQPGLAQLDRLVAQTRAAGLAVQVHVEGDARPLPEALDLSAFRVVQEALTNTLKHAGAASAEVIVRYGDADLELIVSDDGSGNGGPPDAGAGRGLVGMRERVALFHGRLDVGRAPGGGFRVHARLPIAGVLP